MGQRKISGMNTFLVIWAGQLVSMVGSQMASFALAIWAFQETGRASELAAIAFFNWGTTVVVSPLAGVLVDRWNRKLTMMLSDLVAVGATVAVLLLFRSGDLRIWHLYAQAVAVGAGSAFQWPAFSATISALMRKEDYGRASGLNGFAHSAAGIGAPPLAAVLLTIVEIDVLLLVDFLTFAVAIATLAAVVVPPTPQVESAVEEKEGFGRQLAFGWRYIAARPSLLGLQMVLLASVFFSSFAGFQIMIPMILLRSGGDELALGSVQALFGVGGVLSGLLLGIWGGPKRKVDGLFLGAAAQCIGLAIVGAGRVLPVWAAGAFISAFGVFVAIAGNQAIWQAKVPIEFQGRVFATRRMIAHIAGPLAVLAAGPLADRVFEPAMQAGGRLTPLFGPLVGSGAGAGLGLQMVLFGTLGTLVSLSGYLFRATREAESLLPDHAQVEAFESSDDEADEAADLEAVPVGASG